MRVTGYQLKEAIQTWEFKRDTAKTLFQNSLYAFRDEELYPRDEMALLVEAEDAIVKLQAAQAYLNLQVTCEVQGGTMTLAEVIKAKGAASRILAAWKQALPSDHGRGGWLGPLVREKDKEEARPVLGPDDVAKEVQAARKWVNALSVAIGRGNDIETEVWLDSSLLE